MTYDYDSFSRLTMIKWRHTYPMNVRLQWKPQFKFYSKLRLKEQGKVWFLFGRSIFHSEVHFPMKAFFSWDIKNLLIQILTYFGFLCPLLWKSGCLL